jgi:predicted RNA-binding Zn-ribbon protein involved in translation (DUF1610 family)
MTTFFCQMCGAELDVVGEMPVVCPHCGLMTVWATVMTGRLGVISELNELTAEDRRFLYKIRIACE